MEPITRRRFLGQAGIALAGAAAGSQLRSALGDTDLSVEKQRCQRRGRPIGVFRWDYPNVRCAWPYRAARRQTLT